MLCLPLQARESEREKARTFGCGNKREWKGEKSMMKFRVKSIKNYVDMVYVDFQKTKKLFIQEKFVTKKC
jgi:hypothetical protein